MKKKISFYDVYQNSEIIHTYLYYDMPLIYISTYNEKYYLNYFIDTSEEYIDRWFISEISSSDLYKLNTLQLNLRELMINLTKENKMFLLFSNFENEVLKYDIYENIDSGLFPKYDFKIEYDYQNNSILLNEINYSNNDVNISFSDVHDSHNIDSGIFSEIMLSLNEIYKKMNNTSDNFDIHAFSLGSFGVKLTRKNSTLFSTEDINKFVNYFFNLKNNSTSILDYYSDEFGEDTLIQTKKLFKKLNSSNLKFNFKTFDSKSNVFTLTNKDYEYNEKEIYRILENNVSNESTIISLEGTLTSFNSKTGYFNLETNEETKNIKGYIEKNLLSSGTAFIIPSKIQAKVNKYRIFDREKDLIKTNYTIIDYKLLV